jgi:hypothetical protein
MYILMPLLFVGATLPFHPSVQEWRTAGLERELAEVSESLERGEPGRAFDQITRLDARIPYRLDRLRKELLLQRIELLTRLDKPQLARSDSRRLEFLSLPTSSLYALARGINYHLHGARPDLAESELMLAVERDPELASARRWLARNYLPDHPEAALPHLRELFRLEDTLEHFVLYLQTLDELELPGEIWDAMLEEKLPPEDWPPEALQIGAKASESLGKSQRAGRLKALLAQKTIPESNSE